MSTFALLIQTKVGKVHIFWEGHKILSYVVPVKSKVKISQNFVAFSEYMNNVVYELYRIIQWKFYNATLQSLGQSCEVNRIIIRVTI